MKKTNKLVKKPAKMVPHSHSAGELRAEADGHLASAANKQLTRNDRSPQNFAALLKTFGSAKRSSAKANGASSGMPSSSTFHIMQHVHAWAAWKSPQDWGGELLHMCATWFGASKKSMVDAGCSTNSSKESLPLLKRGWAPCCPRMMKRKSSSSKGHLMS